MNYLDNYPLLGQFRGKLKGGFMTEGIVEQIDLLHSRYGDEYAILAERILAMLVKMGYDTVFICQQYIYDYLTQLRKFLKTGEYRQESFEQIKESIYDNADMMLETYMPGLFLAYGSTTILYSKYNLFRNKFLPLLNVGSVGVEVGFGEGFYLWELFSNAPALKFDGYDISEHAITFATKLFGHAGIPEDNYRLALGDITQGIDVHGNAYDFGIIAEVIEHIQDPKKCVQEIARIIKTGGYLYLSTVKDSNHMDHITNFKSTEDVEGILRNCGFDVLDKSIYRIQDDFPKTKDISIGLSYVCRKV